MQDALVSLFEFIMPPRCQLCDAPGHDGMDICAVCLRSLPYIERACPGCAAPLPPDVAAGLCGRCLAQPRAFDRAASLLAYRDQAVTLIARLKFSAGLPAARLLGQLMLRGPAAGAGGVDALLPVPLHVSRLRQRGFNQSVEIARVMNRVLGKRLLLDEVVRVRATPHQLGLDARQRRRNLRGAFATAGVLRAQHVAIIDDVVTTGTTVEELARLLRRAGVAEISVWSVARA